MDLPTVRRLGIRAGPLGIGSLLWLTAAIALTLGQGVAAEPSRHWAFVAPVRSVVPEKPDWAVNEIDGFVAARLAREGLAFAPEADRATWLRRATFGLTGLPPTPEEIAAFEDDPSPQAREKVVDRLLASPAYGEQMAREWLDAARYADSYGRHEDTEAFVWPWRDWVVRAFNDNLPYDQFVTWQTAGDLLSTPTRDQRVATTFNRLAQQSNESGSDEVEFRLDQVADRVKTNATTFLGLTLECAKCHDHKFDPISQREYWQVAAFFDNIDERGVYSQYCPLAAPSPSLPLITPEQDEQLRSLAARIIAQEAKRNAVKEGARPRFQAWLNAHGAPRLTDSAGFGTKFSRWLGFSAPPDLWNPDATAHFVLDPQKDHKLLNLQDPSKPGRARRSMHEVKSPGGKGLRLMGDDDLRFGAVADFGREQPFSFAFWLNPEIKTSRGVVLSRSRAGIDDGRGYELLLEDGRLSFALSYFAPGNELRLRTKSEVPLQKWVHLAATYDGSGQARGMHLFLDGVEADCETVADSLTKEITRRVEWGDKEVDEVEVQLGGRLHDLPLRRCSIADFWVFGRALTPVEVKAVMQPDKEPAPDEWFDWFLAQHDDQWRKADAELHALCKQRNEIQQSAPEIMVMRELPNRRPTFVRERGDYRLPRQPVEPGTPRTILPFPEGQPRNRLGFARWLTDPQNPLTARVEVNRLWQMFFGRGLVATPEDFGVRGERPSHPELLDWLAVEFRESGWDVKALCRRIALSTTFGQSSRAVSPEALRLDPENRLLSRGPSFRLAAEEIRDQALAVSGLLNHTIGGPPVRPYLPNRLYKDSGLQQQYQQDHGEALYRRSLYTFWRRTLPAPDMTAFDAPTRDYCIERRTLTTTPGQALVLLNDPQFLEVSRVLAEDLVRQHAHPGADDASRMGEAFLRLTSRRPGEAERDVLARALAAERARCSDHPADVALLLQNCGERSVDVALPPVEVAATTLVVRSLLGHEEALFVH